MADDVKRSAAEVSAPANPGRSALPAETASRAERARRTVYRGRFAIFYVLLAGVAGAAIGATIVLVGRGSPAPAPPWSDWQPVGSAERRAAQIADRVPDPYRLPSGNQLATVTFVGPPQVTTPDGTMYQVRAIAIQPNTTGGRAEADDIDSFTTSGTVMYTLCGLGKRCSIAEGEPTPARLTLLRREALELGLYTFKYVDDVNSVVVLLPPRPDGKAATAVFLERGDVRDVLRRPLDQTLTAPIVPGVGEISAEELRVIERETRPRLYQYGYLQAQDGSWIMVLAPVLV
jgi:hypothetical protein